ncbi:glycosyltransferase [Candidatus Pacearchaeota archaeon]|nr:glycosyltransferase [Candidatus Pacearchaeota archaeon]
MTKKPKFSIIIPVKEINDYIRNYTVRILEQTYQNFEIIIIPNESPIDKFKMNKTRIIKTGNVGPAQKRDIGAKHARGEILAFIDDDAYPEKDWLKNALKVLKIENVGAVGGPQFTPIESNFFQMLSGYVLASPIVSGPESKRYIKGKLTEYYDLPSCNLFVKKEVFKRVGGFNTSFWPGEDTKLCLDIKKTGKKILYDPKIGVYHHRRRTFKGYIKQIFSYATHRGYFMKKYPETSLKIRYLIPSLFLIGLIGGFFASRESQIIRTAYLAVLTIYIALLIIQSLKPKKLSLIIPFIGLSFITHTTYGIGIIRGLLKRKLKTKLR